MDHHPQVEKRLHSLYSLSRPQFQSRKHTGISFMPLEPYPASGGTITVRCKHAPQFDSLVRQVHRHYLILAISLHNSLAVHNG